MKYSFSKVAVICFSLAFSSAAMAQMKMGIVDMQEVILKVNEGKRAKKRLEKEFNAKGKELKKLRDEVQKLGEFFQNKEKMALMSESALKKKSEKFQKKLMKAQQDEAKFQYEFKRKESEATAKIASKVASIAQTIGAAKGLDVVLEKNSSGLLFAKNPVNLTPEVISAYNKNKVKVAKKRKRKR